VSAVSDSLHRLDEIVGDANLLTATEAVSRYTVDGQQPLAVACPGSPEEVAALLRTAAEARLSVLLRGGGQHLYLGAPSEPIGLVVSLARLDRIVEYQAGDLTVTAQAGVSLGSLQRRLGEHEQVLPLDPPGPATATLGGIAASNLAGPMRMRYGSPRDLVLGLRVALTDGEVIRTGAKTVKNVAGYDLSKLFIGSMGTVGAIVELTLRLIPRPEERGMLMAVLSPERARQAVTEVIGSRLEISACNVITHPAATRIAGHLPITVAGDAHLVAVGLSGPHEAIARQDREMRALLGDACVGLTGKEADSMWEQLRGLAYPREREATLLRISVPIAAVPDVLELISSQPGWCAAAHAGDGIVYAWPAEEADLLTVKKVLDLLRGTASGMGGFAILESGSVALKRQFPVWGDQVANGDLMAALKAAYDPTGVLGCGRFVC